MSINKLIMDQHGTKKETNQEAHGGITTMHGDIIVASNNQRRNQNQDQGGKEAVGPHVHISLGWMDAHAWYQLATLLSRSYCMVSSHVSG
jgi:hypothetical protein